MVRVSQAGGLAIMWKKYITVDLRSFSQNHIDVNVVLPGEYLKWRCTGFCGITDQAYRDRSWDLLRQLTNHSDLSCVIRGDFNETLCTKEMEGGVPRAANLIDNFRLALLDCS